jgi:hypothetical protein
MILIGGAGPGAAYNMDYGMLYTTGGGGTQNPGVAYAKVTQLDSNGLSSTGVTPDATNNKITVSRTGIYTVFFQASFSGAINEPVMMRVYWNAVAQTHLTFRRVLGAGGDGGSASLVGLVDVTAADTEFDVRAKTDNASKAVVIQEAQLAVFRIANT